MGTRVDFTVPGDATVTTTLKAVGALFVDNIEIDTTNAITNQTFVFNGTKFVPSFAYSPSGEPIGFQNRTDSTISFTNATRTFSISPTAASFVVWNGSSRYVKTTTETVVIPNTSALHFIFYDAAGVLSTRTTSFVLSTEAPVACVYWNATDSVQYLFAEERHGITLDWQTHEYLHRTRGAAYASGFDAATYTLAGTGASNADAQIDILNGVFFDEDIEVSVSHAASPVANTWQQRLQGGAYIPAFYKTGTGVWKKDIATQYPLKVGASPRACYNLNTAGTWTTPELGQNKYGISWLVATNNLNEPVIAILGQAEYNNQGDAEAVQWGQLDLGGFPVAEFRPLYKVIYQTSTAYANTPKARFTGLSDLRSSGGTSGGIAVTAVDHGALTGLADDDHPQYLLADGTRGFTAPLSGNLTISGNLTVNGTTTTINSTVTTVDDPIITLGGDTAPTADDNKDRGIEFRWHNGTVAKVGFFGYDDSTGKFTFIPDATNTSEVFSGTKGTLDAFVDWADVTNKPSNLGLDSVYVNVTGDTMTGTLTVTGYGALVSTTPTQGSSVSPFGTQSISASPFSRQWADILRWRLPTLTETSVDGTTFTTSTSTDWTHRPFIGDVSGTMVTVPALDGSTTTSVRWTWGASTLQFSAAAWLALAVRYSLPAPVITAIWETSPDGTTWTTQATAASVTATNRWSFIRFDESATSIAQNRITIKREAGTVFLTSVQWLTPRPGDQGTGANRELPFTFGVGRNIILQPTLTTSTPLQVRGASGHTSTLQRWEDPTGATAYLQVLSDGRLQSTLATGTAPLVIASTTLVANLNADLLDGQDGTYYTNWTNITNKPSPVITLTGDLTGNVTLSSLTNASLAATISPNSVDLGVDTTGNYVATIASGETNGITVSGSGTETAAVTLFLPQSLHASATPTFSRAVLTQATGTAPLTVTSTTVVGNLNADLLDGQHGSWYQDWTNVSNKPSPSITLTGDVTGVATLTSLTSASISATVSSNASALSASNLLTKILTVDGAGSLLDADLLDGNQATFFASQAALEAVLGDLLYVGLYDAKTYGNTTPSFRVPNPAGTNVNYLSLASAAPPTDASIDFRVDCIRPANDTTINRRPFQWNNFFVFTNGALSVSIASSISTFPGHTVAKATLDAIAAVGSRIQLRLVWDATADTLTSFARAATGNSTLPLTDNTGWTQVGTSTHAGIILSNTSRTPFIGYGDSNSAFDGHIYGVTGYVNASLTYNIRPSDVGNIKTVSTFTANAGGSVTVVRGGADQTELVIKTLPIPAWTGSAAAGGSVTANTTYRNAMYWVVASTGDLDFVDADLSGRYDYGGQDATVGVANGDWIIALKSGGGAGPNEDLSLSQVTFQVLPFSSETFVRSVVQQHQEDINDPHAAAGYLMRSPGTTLNLVTVFSTQRSASAASITTTTAHGLLVNDKAYISGVGASYDGTYVVNGVPSATVFSYATTVGTAASALAPTGATAGKLDDRRFADVVFAPKEHNHNTDIQTQIAAHAAAADPHPIYLTQTEGSGLYADKDHLHSGLYEVAGTMAAHLSRFDHTSWITRAQGDGLYLGVNTTFDARYYLKTEVDAKIAGIAAEVYATDGAQSARIFIGSTEPSSVTVQRGDLWIETNNIALAAPSAPTNFTGTAAGASVTLGWSPWSTSAAISSLTLEWALNASFTGASALPATPATITSYTHTGLTENTLYYYRLRATNAAGTGPNASISITSANVAPPTPTISASAVAGTANIQATFSAAAYTDAPANRFIMHLNNASVAAVASSPYTFTGLTEGVSYTVGVQTVDTGGLTSSIVNASPVTTNNIAPPAPSSASATVINNNQIQATWPAVSITDFSNYQVQPFFSSNSASAQAAQTTTNTNYTFTGLAFSTGYFVRVWTRDTASNQSASFAQSASVTTTAPPDATAPAEATITSFRPETSYGNMVIRGNWPSDADFTSATIERSTDNTTWTVDQSYTSQTPGASFSRTLANGPYASGQTVYARVKVTDTNGNTRTGATQSYTLIASPSFIAADSTNSWRNTNGGQYNVNGNFRPYQGFFSNAAWNAIGFWYYGTKPNTELSNNGRRTITGLRFFIIRWDSGNSAAMNPVFALHDVTSSPGTVAGVAAPTLYSQDQLSSIAVTTIAGGANTGYTTLPAQWGIDLVAGTRRGVAVYDSSSPVYANFASVVDNGYSGLLEFTHLG